MYTVPDFKTIFWLFCTGKQVSLCCFTQFCNLPKKDVAFPFSFVYNVIIRVSAPIWKDPLPERSKNYYVYR